MPKLSDVYAGDVFHTIIKGEHGTGKSIAAISYAVLGPTYVFDFEDRMRSVATYYRTIKRPEVLDNVEYDTYFSFNKMRKKFEAIESKSGAYKNIRNVIIDSLTSFTLRALINTKDFKADKAEETGQRLGKTIGEFRVNSMEDYNAETAAIQEFIIEHALILKSMKINVILTAHVIKVKEENEEGKTHVARYLMTGGKKAAQIIPGWYDEIYHTNVEPDANLANPPHYTVITRHSGNDTAKTAINLPVKIDFTGKVFFEEVRKYVPLKPDISVGLVGVDNSSVLSAAIKEGNAEK
jgi:hypothetical protein